MTKRAIQSFAKQGEDAIIVVNSDHDYAEDHPYVIAWPEMFRSYVPPVAETVES